MVTIVATNYVLYKEQWNEIKIQLIDVVNYLDRYSTIFGLNVFAKGRREQIGKFDRISHHVWSSNLKDATSSIVSLDSSTRKDIQMLKDADEVIGFDKNIRKLSKKTF
jgi:hypothetical protein